MDNSIPEFPPCFKCQGGTRLLSAISAHGEAPEVFIAECTKCAATDMYIIEKGVLRRL